MPRITFAGIPGTAIELLPGGSPEFIAALNSAADASAVALLQPIAPYSMVVRNSASEGLLAVSIRLSLKGIDGRVVTHQGVFKGSVLRSIRPGALILLAPQPGLSHVLSPGGSMRIPRGADLSTRLASRAYLYAQQTEISISLDSAIFPDGSIIGPDLNHTLETLNSEAGAEEAVASEVMRLDSAEIRDYLRGLIAVPVPPYSNPGQVNYYAAARHIAARRFLDRLEGESMADFYSYLAGLPSARGPLIVRRVR